jgi:hypothetical protein
MPYLYRDLPLRYQLKWIEAGNAKESDKGGEEDGE